MKTLISTTPRGTRLEPESLFAGSSHRSALTGRGSARDGDQLQTGAAPGPTAPLQHALPSLTRDR